MKSNRPRLAFFKRFSISKLYGSIPVFLILGLSVSTQAQKPGDLAVSTDTAHLAGAYPKNTMPNEAKADSLSGSCVDLALDSIKVIKITGNSVTLEYCICNKGTAPAALYGDNKSMKNHVAVHFYFSGTNRITRGSVFADGIFVTEGLKATKGMLAPGLSVKQTMKLSLEKRIGFYKVIVLEVDAMNVIENECDETNNVGFVIPAW